MSRLRRCVVVNAPHATRAGIGQFAGQVDPHDPTHATVVELLDSMTGPAAMRLAPQMAHRRRTLTATGVESPQRFVHTAGANSAEALSVVQHAPIKRNQSRALGQFRGTPGMA